MQIVIGGMQIAVAAFLALQMWGASASAQTSPKQYSVSISIHRDLTDDQRRKLQEPGIIQGILDDASKILKTRDSGDDVSCDVTLKLKGTVGEFGSAETPKVVEQAHIDTTHRIDSTVDADFHIKVVESIKHFCRFQQGTFFAGCAFPPNFRSIIVEYSFFDSSVPAHILWAHEFGHLTGLGHLAGTEARSRKNTALMTACELQRTNVEVNEHECKCLQSGPGFGPNGTCNLQGQREHPECGS